LPAFAKLQVEILIVSSLIFYSYEQPALVLLLVFSALLNVFVSYYIAFGKTKYKKTFATLGVILNLSGIAFFKYSPLIGGGFFDTSDGIGHFLLTIPLPIGISFFTFEGISLLVDVYSGKHFDNRKLIPSSLVQHTKRTLFFISFFPHLVSGPILKAHDFYPQIGIKKFGDIDWNACFRALIVGYFLKMVCADNLKDFTFWLAYPYYQGRSSLDLITMLFGYSFQIFADFAGTLLSR
jgi:alginate O-acetyltransferase complex protein AlgI